MARSVPARGLGRKLVPSLTACIACDIFRLERNTYPKDGAMAEISDFERQEIQRYLKWNEKRLFRELDRYYGASLPGGQRPSYRFRGKARAWFSSLLPRLREHMREEWGYEEKKQDPELQDQENLVIAVGEALLPLLERNPFPTGAQAPTYLVSAIVVQVGLD